jgi:ADP-ribose pyrophosphatase YjhB (NUDIX family)
MKPAQHAPPASGPPKPADAVAALLVLTDGRYVMQLRDNLPGIFYPGHWGCFGGAVERGEDLVAALRRELREELEFEFEGAARFSQFDFDFAPLGHPKVFRVYFEVRVPDAALAKFVLHEGAEVRAFGGPELLANHRVTPYDAFAVWMHLNRTHYRAAA